MGLIYKAISYISPNNKEVLQRRNQHEQRCQVKIWRFCRSFQVALRCQVKALVHAKLTVAIELLVSVELENLVDAKWEMLVVVEWMKFNGCQVRLKPSCVEFIVIFIMQ